MAAPTETYIDPAVGAAAGNDHGGAGFVDGSFANATNTLTKVGAFPAATCQAGDKLYLDDNGSGEVTPGLYTINVRVNDDSVTLTADIRSGVNDPTDVRCDQHTGAVGLPWATVQHALDFTTRDAVNGDRFNVKAGTDDVLAAALDFSTYGVPDNVAPWALQGYTTAAADGGVGGISGGGAVGIIGGDALNYLYIADMHLHNCGAADVLSVNDYIAIVNCEIDNTTANGLDIDRFSQVINCHIHNCGNIGIFMNNYALVAHNTLENGINDFVEGISVDDGSVIIGNVIDIDGASDGIVLAGHNIQTLNNSIYSSSGTGQGIIHPGDTFKLIIVNNIVEGFSGVGGIGISLTADTDCLILGHNAFYNNTTHLSFTGFTLIDLTANDLNPLAASAFMDAANGDFRVNTSVQALAYLADDFPNLSVRSYLDIGALQRKEPGGVLKVSIV